MRISLRGVRATAASLLFVLSAGLLSAADRAPADRLVPGGASLFLRITDVPKTADAWKKSAIGQLWNSSEMGEFRKEVEAKWEEALKESAESPVPVQDLLKLPQGEVALAVVHEEDSPIGGVLLIEYGDKQSIVDKALDALDKALEEHGAQKATDTVDGVEVTVFSFKNDNDEEIPYKLAYGTKEGCLLVGTSTSLIESVLDRWDGKEADCLAEDEIYSYIHKKVQHGSGDTSALDYFVSPVDLLQGILASNEQLSFQAVVINTYLQSLGIGQLKGVGGAAEIAEGSYDSWARTFIYADQPAKGVMKIFHFPTKKLEVPAWVDESVAQFSSISWDPQTAWSGIEAVGDTIMGRPGSLAKQIDALSKREPNVHLKKDVIDQLSGGIQMVSNGMEVSESGTPQERQVIMLGLKGESKIKELVAKLTGMAPQIEKRDFEGTTIYDIPANGQMQPSIAVANGNLLFSTNSAAIESVLRTKTADKPLADNADFKALTKDAPEEVSFFSFSRLDKSLEAFYEMARKGDFDAATEGKLDFKTLPDFDAIRKYFRPQLSFAVPDDNGAVIENFALPLK